MAAQFQELGLDQLCRVIVPGHPDGVLTEVPVLLLIKFTNKTRGKFPL